MQMRDEFCELGRPYTLSYIQIRKDWLAVAETIKAQTHRDADQWRAETLESIREQEFDLWRELETKPDVRIHDCLIRLREQKMNLLGLAEKKAESTIGNRQVNIIEALTITNTGPADLKRCLEMATTIEEVTNEPMSVEQPAA